MFPEALLAEAHTDSQCDFMQNLRRYLGSFLRKMCTRLKKKKIPRSSDSPHFLTSAAQPI